MKRILACSLLIGLFSPSLSQANLLDKLIEYRDQQKDGKGRLDTNTVAAGLKEALSIGAKNSVSLVSKMDGYYGNRLIRIPVPEKIERIERLMRKAGLSKEVDRFILTMNRAAEKAAPQALGFFIDAVKEMTIPDAMQILRGNDTAATQFLKTRTYDRIYGVFKPVVSSAMNEVNVTHAFKEMMGKARSIPFLKIESVDLDQYVTAKALDGLFLTVGQEEQRIRKDPRARVTDLLKKVFQ